MLSAKCWPFFSGPNIGLFDAYFSSMCTYHQQKLKREIVHISKFQNKILYQSKKIPDTFSTSSKRLQEPKWKSMLCSTIFIISYQTLRNVCVNQVHQFAICTICTIHYTKYHTIQYRNHVLNRKKRYSIKYFRNISWDIYMSIISQIKYIPILRNMPAVCPMFQ